MSTIISTVISIMSISVEDVLKIFVQFRQEVITIGIDEKNEDLLNLCNYYRDSVILNLGVILVDEPSWTGNPCWRFASPEIIRNKKINDVHRKTLADINDCRHILKNYIRSAEWHYSKYPDIPLDDKLEKLMVETTAKLKYLQTNYKTKYQLSTEEDLQPQISFLIAEQKNEEKADEIKQQELTTLSATCSNWLTFIKHRGVTGILRKTDDRYNELKAEWEHIKQLKYNSVLKS